MKRPGLGDLGVIDGGFAKLSREEVAVKRWEDYGMKRVRIELGSTWVRSRHSSGMIHAVVEFDIYRELGEGRDAYKVRHICVKFACNGKGFDDRLVQVVIDNVRAMGGARDQGKLCNRCELRVLRGGK